MNTNCCNIQYCNSSDVGKLKIKLIFSRKELLYDIKNYAYIEGQVMGEENQNAQHTLVDIGEDGNIDRVSRVLNVVHAQTIEMLYPYTKEEPIEEEINDELEEPENYIIEIRVPKTFSRTTVVLLSRLIHEYMVYSVLHDWLSVTYPKAADNWLLKKENAEKDISSIKNLRRGSFIRKITTPF